MYFSEATIEAKVLFFSKKLTPSLPPIIPWRGEKCLHQHLQQHHHHHHLQDQLHPLAVLVDWNPRLSLLNLVHVCSWGFDIMLWWIFFSDCVVFITPHWSWLWFIIVSSTLCSQVTRVNSTNVLDEGLRIGKIGRRMNSKVKSVK
jgi:hypothetical protein